MAQRPRTNDLNQHLENVMAAADDERAAKVALAETVRRARKSGASWQEIADKIGVTKHAAHKRFREEAS